jgi:hypothetical protein
MVSSFNLLLTFMLALGFKKNYKYGMPYFKFENTIRPQQELAAVYLDGEHTPTLPEKPAIRHATPPNELHPASVAALDAVRQRVLQRRALADDHLLN